MSTVPPDRPEPKNAVPPVNENQDSKSSRREAGSHADGSQHVGGDPTEKLKSDAADKDPNESDLEYLERAVKAFNKAVDARTSPERLARYAKYVDDPILKREGFVAAGVLPGEDPKEFEDLLAEVVNDLQLEGEVQLRIGLVITCYLWRLNNLEIFDKAQRARAKYGKYFKNASRLGWRVAQLAILSHMEGDRLREMALKKEERELIKLFNEASEQMAPMNSNKAAADVSVADKMKAMQLVKQLRFEPEAIPDLERVQVDSDLAELGDLLTAERFTAELEMQERLCACISRCLKLVMEIKGIEEKLGSAPASVSRPRLMIKSGKPPKWGGVRLVTTKRGLGRGSSSRRGRFQLVK
jgi:hypothetical protein